MVPKERFGVVRGWPFMAGAVILLATCAKWHLIASGPDLEMDPYGHALAGRRMLLDPFDISLHWVWLPLGHAMYALSFALGLGMNGVRYANAIFTSVLPCLLAACLVRRASRRWSALPCLAASILAMSPVVLSVGESGALEPLFACLVLTVILGWCMQGTRMRAALGAALAGLAASAAVMLRYEGWVLPLVFFALWWRGGRGVVRAGVWILPSLTIASYLLARRLLGHASLSFVHDNLVFARGFFPSTGEAWSLPPHLLWMTCWYPLIVPARELGPLIVLALAGVSWTSRKTALAWRATLLAIVFFLTVGLVAHQHLGLVRHALSFAPLYATAAAAGILAVAVRIRRRFLRRTRLQAPVIAFGLAGACLLLLAGARTVPAFAARLQEHAVGYQREYRTALALREQFTPSSVVHCDDTPVEVLSQLPPAAFVRWQIPDTGHYNLSIELQSGKRPLIVTRRERAGHVRDRCRTLFEDGDFVVLEYIGTANQVSDVRPVAP